MRSAYIGSSRRRRPWPYSRIFRPKYLAGTNAFDHLKLEGLATALSSPSSEVAGRWPELPQKRLYD